MRKYKMRSDSTWNKLSAEQRTQLEDWLFTERVPYSEILDRVQKEFGIKSSLASLSRYYHFRKEERAVEDLAGVDRTVKAVNGVKVDLVGLRESSLKLIGRRLLACALDNAEIKDLTALGRLLLEAQWRGIQENRLELAREKFQFDAAEAALAEIPRMQEVSEEDYKKEKERVNGLIARLFRKLVPGKVPPKVVLPDGVLAHGHQKGGEDVKT
jgi:hypothetical protein